jgi:2-dehydro-3-deoxy-D-arabinonate dehydratase
MYYLTRHMTPGGPCWARDGQLLPKQLRLSFLLSLPRSALTRLLAELPAGPQASDPLLAPLEPMHEVWACGVTYQRSREARRAESELGDVYDRVYVAERPEVFFKSIGWRVVGHGAAVHIRADSQWNVPEPEMVLVVNAYGEIVGFTAGNDMSSRSIEGENPLYLPQAKIFSGACALGPGLELLSNADLAALPIRLEIERQGVLAFSGDTNTSQMSRSADELVSCLRRELDFPDGVFLMTGTGIVPPDGFSLAAGDVVRMQVGDWVLENVVRG